MITLSYELAKELKDSGFPQDLLDPSSYYAGETVKRLFGWSEGEDQPTTYVKCPTLSELIEACGSGDGFLLTEEPDGEWFAMLNGKRKKAYGITPEEVVAKLWLALNKKIK